MGNDGVFLEPPVRYSPRLAAIGAVSTKWEHFYSKLNITCNLKLSTLNV